MERLTFEGNFCEIARCVETQGGAFCPDGSCTQRQVWERLKEYEDIGLTPEEIIRLIVKKAEGEYVKCADCADAVIRRYSFNNEIFSCRCRRFCIETKPESSCQWGTRRHETEGEQHEETDRV